MTKNPKWGFLQGFSFKCGQTPIIFFYCLVLSCWVFIFGLLFVWIYVMYCSICSRYGIHSLPSIIMVNRTSRVRYRGPKNLISLVQFYKKTTGAILLGKTKIIWIYFLHLSKYKSRNNYLMDLTTKSPPPPISFLPSFPFKHLKIKKLSLLAFPEGTIPDEPKKLNI